mgnify:CR=1 FL=1
MSVAEEIRLIRQRSLMTQKEFARRLNIAFSTLNRWENEKATPSVALLRRIKSFCDEADIPFEPLRREWIKVNKTK